MRIDARSAQPEHQSRAPGETSVLARARPKIKVPSFTEDYLYLFALSKSLTFKANLAQIKNLRFLGGFIA